MDSPNQNSRNGLNSIHKLYTIKIQFVCHCLPGKSGISIIYRFNDLFQEIRRKARIQEHKTFHDIRRTAITNFFYEGLEINEVMKLAGHSKYDTTVQYYLSVKDDLMNKARKAVKYRVSREMLEKCLGG